MNNEYKTIKKSGLFDEKYYLTTYEDVRKSDIDPIKHYIKNGWKEGRNPTERFDTNFYLESYPDVRDAGLNPLVHFIQYGSNEGRSTHPENSIVVVHKVSKIKKLITIAKYAKNNPHLIKKTLRSLKKKGFKSTIIKVKQKLYSQNGYVSTNNNELSFRTLPLATNLQNTKNLKIAVIIHAYYADVLEDIMTSLSNITPKPDLYISVSENTNTLEIESFLKLHGFKNSFIKQVPNRGRDIAPFLIEFGTKIMDYDLCCKVHGKKSLYSGSDRSDWREHLYYNLMGSKEIVDDILSKFIEDQKIGLVFSDNYGMLPYWGYSWLTNKNAVNYLLHKFKLTELFPLLDKTYIDYPAGTMFWFRPQAIKQLIHSDIKYIDFPEEPIGNDGTIAHGIERLIGYTVNLNGYDFIEVNYKQKFYNKNICHKNFNQHEAKTLEKAKEIVTIYEYVIFDIFDTLVSRTVYDPDNVFRILESQIDRQFNIKSNFFELRKRVEENLRQELINGTDVKYTDIYDNMKQFTSYAEEIIEYARNEEFSIELKVLKPKKESIELLNFAIKKNKKVFLVSDMYLTKGQLLQILRKFKIDTESVKLLVSSDTGFRKDNTTIWKSLIQNDLIDADKTLMIGDSEVSDAKIPGDFGITSFHLLSEKNSFLESSLYKNLNIQKINQKNLALIGPSLNYIFSSPFEVSNNVLKFQKKLTPYEFGYIALAPFMYLFMSNIYKKYSNNHIYFIARDGYFLEKVFNHFVKTKKISLKYSTKYLLISRRAIMGAVLKNEHNLEQIICHSGQFSGLFSQLIFDRMGLNSTFLLEAQIADFRINSSDDLDIAYNILKNKIDLINKYTADEHSNYMSYLENINFFSDKERVIVDIGYSGTIQNFLGQIKSQKIIGEYFITTDRIDVIESKNIILNGFFSHKLSCSDRNNTLYKYALILEAFLTSDKGQLICFKDDQPVFKDRKDNIKIQQEILDGILHYIENLSVLDVDFIETENIDVKNLSVGFFEYIVKNRLFDNNLKKLFLLEDDFTGIGTLNILDILKDRGL